MRKKQRPTAGDQMEILIGDNARNIAVGKDVRQVIGLNFVGNDAAVSGGKAQVEEVVDAVPKSETFERITAATRMTIRQLELDYEQARQQATNWSRISISAAGAGFVIVLVGIVLLLLGYTTVGILTSISSIVPEIAAALFFQQTKQANTRIDTYHRDLLEAQAINQALELCETIENDEAKMRLKETVIKNVLGIKN